MCYCEKCKINVAGDVLRCPLCGERLTGEMLNEAEAFPLILSERSKRYLVFKILIFLSVITAAVCFVINASIEIQSWWLNYVLAGFASFWIVFGIIIKKRKNPIKAILWTSVATSILVFLWDLATGFSFWSIDFVLPLLYICAITATVVLSRFLHLKPQDYIFYLVINILLGIIPLILYLFSVLNIVYPSAICAAFSIVTMASLIIFKGDALKEELDRRMHF